MAWTFKFTETADKSFAKLDKAVQQRILKKLSSLCASNNPTTSGKALTGDMTGFWRYRVGDYRVICSIEDGTLVVLVIDVGHRKDIYRKPRHLE